MASPLPSLHGLRAFESAGRHLSFTRAAEELGVTQTAVSHLIRRLEAELGARLFIRDARRIRLSPEGERLLPTVAGAFDDLRRATERFRRDPGSRRLTLSTTPGFAGKWLVPRLHRFRARHPRIEVRIGTGMEMTDFRRDDVDLAIRFGKGQWPGVAAEFLMAENIFPVCAPALVDGNPPLRQPADLARHTLIQITSSGDDWTLWFTGAGVAPVAGRQTLVLDMVLTAIEAAVDGLGVMIGRETLLREELRSGRLVLPFETRIQTAAGYYLVMPPENAELPPVRAFRDWIVAEASASPVADPML